ncbi:unannotated protein [freshwater metagenome]|uniref:Unannotated protein n=1 Tax=freshwater metagenome TaxID=449393 RepID=A0A6J5YLH6_9ZZZZ
MIASDHLHVDTCDVARGDGITGFGTRWVDDADESLKNQLVDPELRIGDSSRVGEDRSRIDDAGGHSEHPHTLGGQTIVVVKEMLPGLISDGVLETVAVDDERRSTEQHIRSALHADEDIARRIIGIDTMKRGHELGGGIERDLCESRLRDPDLIGVDTELGRRHHQRCFGGVAHDGGVAVLVEQPYNRVGTQRHGESRSLRSLVIHRRTMLGGDNTLCGVTLAGESPFGT